MTLIGYWPLNEDSDASEAKDHSGNENHGTINDGGDSTVPGANGILGQNAYSFDGKNDSVNLRNFSKFSSYTLSGWFNVKDYSTGDFLTTFHITKNNDVHPGLWHSSHSGDPIESFRFWQRDNNGTNHEFYSDKLSTETWHHFAQIWNGSIMKGFINGVNVGETSVTSINTSREASDAIGYSPTRSRYAFNGRMAEMRIYNRPLTKSEIQYLYNTSKRGQQVTSKKTS